MDVIYLINDKTFTNGLSKLLYKECIEWISYIKDLHNNYLVLPKGDDNGETYCARMLQANSIECIIKPNKRTIDNSILYYYDITAKQTIDIYIIKPINLTN